MSNFKLLISLMLFILSPDGTNGNIHKIFATGNTDFNNTEFIAAPEIHSDEISFESFLSEQGNANREVFQGKFPLLFNLNGDYGKNLPILKNLMIGPCSDAAVDGAVLYAIGSNSIYSFDISSPRNPILLDSLNGLGNVRQIQVQSGLAYVTSREEGLFIINVSNPKKMVKASHYDTLELATGISVSGSLSVVANRQYGIELIDISN